MEVAELKLPRFTAAMTHESPWWVAAAWRSRSPAQGETLEQARANLAEALALYFEDEPGHLGVGEAPIIVPVDVDVGG